MKRGQPQACRRAAIVILAALVVTACGDGKTAAPAEAAAPGPRTVDVVRVLQQPIDMTLSLPGELDAYQAVAIVPKITGFVRTIGVDRGSRVRAGALLATLEAPEVTAQQAEADSRVQSADAQLQAARSKADATAGTYDRLKAAAATPGVVAGNDLVVAQKAVEADRSQVTAAQNNLEAARQALKSVSDIRGYLRVTAPFAGVITERNVHPGALVGPGSGQSASAAPMLRLMEDDRLRLVVAVPEAYLAGMTTGARLTFSVPAYPARSFSGTLARISQTVDVKTRTMPVELEVTNKDELLAPGTFCQVRWPVRRQGPSLLVPSASIASTTDRTFVVQIRDGKTAWVDVKSGVTSGALVEVFGDLHAGDVIAARATDELRPGTAVLTKAAAPPAK